MQQKLAILVLDHISILTSLSQYYDTSSHETSNVTTTASSTHKQAVVSPDYHMPMVSGHVTLMDDHQSTPSDYLHHHNIDDVRAKTITEIATTQIDCIAMPNSHVTNHMTPPNSHVTNHMTTNKDPSTERLTFSMADLLEPSSNRENYIVEERPSSLYHTFPSYDISDITDIGSHQTWPDACHATNHVTSHDIDDLLWHRKSSAQSCATPTQLFKSSAAQPVWRPYNDSTHLSLSPAPSSNQAGQSSSSFRVGHILDNT